MSRNSSRIGQGKIQACHSCRKSKTRCEIIGVFTDSDVMTCHRCRVVKTACSYAEMDRKLFRQYIPFPGQRSPSNSLTKHVARATADSSSSISSQPLFDPSCPPPASAKRFNPVPATTYLQSLRTYLSHQSPLDWTSPLVSMHELLHIPPPDSEPTTNCYNSDISLDDILSKSQTKDLLAL